MFNLFKRTKIEDWEITLLLNVIDALPANFNRLKDQVRDGLFRGVFTNASDIEGYTAFTFNNNVFKKYDNRTGKSYTLQGIKVYDTKTDSFVRYAIYVSSGVINGYSIQGMTKYKIDPNKFDIDQFRQVFNENADYKEIESLLSSSEKEIVNPSEVYAVELNGKKYYHLLEIEDGNFIGLDLNKKIYEIRHDPFEITEIQNKTLVQILKG